MHRLLAVMPESSPPLVWPLKLSSVVVWYGLMCKMPNNLSSLDAKWVPALAAPVSVLLLLSSSVGLAPVGQHPGAHPVSGLGFPIAGPSDLVNASPLARFLRPGSPIRPQTSKVPVPVPVPVSGPHRGRQPATLGPPLDPPCQPPGRPSPNPSSCQRRLHPSS